MRRARTWGWLVGLFAVVACSGSPSATPLPAAVRAVVDAGAGNAWMTADDDTWAVVICHVPANTQSAAYGGLPLRLPLQPSAVAAVLEDNVTRYFATLSNDAYHLRFIASGDVTIAPTDEPQACVDLAIESFGERARGVIVVADAEQAATAPGGFGSPGETCAAPPCTAATTRRSVYVGASDFGPDWGDRPPMDLIEHELGHALGWPHSGYDESASEPHRSALDVMSNSAAPRSVNPDRRDAPDTLGINRLAAGWLPASAVAVVDSASTVTLGPSNGTSGTRLAVIALDGRRFLTVELLMAAGLDDHLPADGVAVHLIDGAGSTRVQTPLVGVPPYDDLLTPGETFTSNGWSVSIADGWRATLQPIGDPPTVSG